MGDSSTQIDEEIRETRDELDRQLTVLERRAASGARKYGLLAAGIAVGVLAVAAGVVLYRRRRQTPVRRLHTMVRSARRLSQRAMERLPIKVVVMDKARDERSPGTLWSVAHKVAPAIAGSATGAVLARFERPASRGSSSG